MTTMPTLPVLQGRGSEPHGIPGTRREVALWLLGRSLEPVLGGPVSATPEERQVVADAAENIKAVNASQDAKDAKKLATVRLATYLEAGLKRRLRRFVWELGGANTYAALVAHGVDCASPRACPICGWVFDPLWRRPAAAARSRKGTAQLCYRCGDRATRPPRTEVLVCQVCGWGYQPGPNPACPQCGGRGERHPRPPTRAYPVLDEDGSVVDWERWEAVECVKCERLIVDRRRMSQRGPPRWRCYDCQHGLVGVYKYVAKTPGRPGLVVKFFRPDGKQIVLAADDDGVIRTPDAEDALTILDGNTELHRVSGPRPPK